MKKIIVNIIIIVSGVILSNFITKVSLLIIDKFDLISDNGRLTVLFIPFIIYGIVLLGIVPYIIKRINQ